MTYRIWCICSGGRTGHREAWLKADGVVRTFLDRTSAEVEARRLNEVMNGAGACAWFNYSVVGEV